MLSGLGRLIHRRRWTSLVLILVMTAIAGAWGLGVFAKFKEGGFEDPDASSTLVAKPAAISTTHTIAVTARLRFPPCMGLMPHAPRDCCLRQPTSTSGMPAARQRRA